MTLLELGGRTQDGHLVEVAAAWFDIISAIGRDPSAAYGIGPRAWEEIIAGAYRRTGFDEVILTPRSRDKGRDVVATKNGVGSIRIFDQVKAYRPGHVVSAEEVRALIGVLAGAQNVSKGIVTTTSTFAPHLERDDYIRPFLPYRLELRPRHVLLPWLAELGRGDSSKAASRHRAGDTRYRWAALTQTRSRPSPTREKAVGLVPRAARP